MKVAKNKSFLLMIFIFILFIFPLPVFASVTIVSGYLNTIGSTIKIGDDFFYVIGKEDDTHIQVITKYNLGVGYGFEENPIYKQTVIATGAVEGGYPNPGGICDYVLTNTFTFPSMNTNFVVDGFNNYINYLTNEGAVITDYNILSYNKYMELSNNERSGLNAPVGHEFIYQTNYWIQSRDDFFNWYIPKYLWIDPIGYGFCHYTWGLRPVFTIEVREELERYNPDVLTIEPQLSGSKYILGETYKIGDEEFYIIGKDDETHLKLLSKYNLGVGSGFETPTYKQDKNASGWKNDSNDAIGTTDFSDDAYWANSHSLETTLQEKYGTTYPSYIYDESSRIKEMLDNYVNYLSQNGKVVTARLIKQEELNGLGCNPYEFSCSNAPTWVYSTSYWTGSVVSPSFINYVNTSGRFGADSYMQKKRYGVRPVILLEIEKEEQEKKDEDTNLTLDSEEANGWNEKEKLENPETGAFISISIILLLIIVGIILIIYSKKKNKFKKL